MWAGVGVVLEEEVGYYYLCLSMYLLFDVVVLFIKTDHWRIHVILGIFSMYETTKPLVTAICRAICVLKPKTRNCFFTNFF